MTSIQYKINARKAIAGSPHLGSILATTHAASSIVPETHGDIRHSAIATVTFGATAYTCTETVGRIKLQVICERFNSLLFEWIRQHPDDVFSKCSMQSVACVQGTNMEAGDSQGNLLYP